MRLLLLLAGTWLLIAQAHAGDFPLLVDLAGDDWQVHVADEKAIPTDGDISALPSNVAGWQAVRVPGLLLDQDIWLGSGRAWFRTRFDAPDLVGQAGLGLFLGRVLEADKVWLNGKLIGGFGRIDNHGLNYVGTLHSLRYLKLPKELLKPRDNVLFVETQSVITGGGILHGPIGVALAGPAWKYVGQQHARTVFAQTLILAVAVVALLLSLSTLMIRQRHTLEHWSFIALFALLIPAVGIDSLLFHQSGLKTSFWQQFMLFASGLVPLAALLYVHGFSRRRLPAWLPIFIGYSLLSSGSFFFIDDITTFSIVAGLHVLVALGAMAWMHWLLWPQVRRGDHAALLISVGLICTWLTGIVLFILGDPSGEIVGKDEIGLGIIMLCFLLAFVLRLLELQHQLRNLSLKVVHQSETERQHIAQELHDGINQRLASARFRVQMLNAKLPQTGLGDVSDELHQAMEEMDRVVHGLKPLALERRGLIGAMRLEAEGQQRASGIAIETRLAEIQVDEGLARHLFRIFQECLGNAIKHAKPSRVRIALESHRSRLALSVTDDGIGMDPKAVRAPASRERGGLGLVSLHERVTLIDGVLSIRSTPGQGTAIIVEVPHVI